MRIRIRFVFFHFDTNQDPDPDHALIRNVTYPDTDPGFSGSGSATLSHPNSLKNLLSLEPVPVPIFGTPSLAISRTQIINFHNNEF